jgi:hypothetical protein
MPKLFWNAAVVLSVCAGLAGLVHAARGQVDKPLKTIEGGVLDEIKLYGDAPAPNSRPLVARLFSATDADLAASGQKGELTKDTKEMQGRAPRLLASALVAKAKELATFTDVSVVEGDAPPAGAVVVEGHFTLIDPGSRAKRYFVGFGAGKSGVAVTGTVTRDGVLLAAFIQKRIGVMGMAGGDSMGKLVSDSTSIGEDIAEFLAAWAAGKKLK